MKNVKVISAGLPKCWASPVLPFTVNWKNTKSDEIFPKLPSDLTLTKRIVGLPFCFVGNPIDEIALVLFALYFFVILLFILHIDKQQQKLTEMVMRLITAIRFSDFSLSFRPGSKNRQTLG